MNTGVEHAGDSAAEIEDRCLRCGYDLRGLGDDQPCSECGLLAERSRNPSAQLVDAPPWLIRRLAIGARLLLWAVLGIVGFVGLLMFSELFLTYLVTRHVQRWMPYVLSAATLSWLAGAWLLTSRGTPVHIATMPRRLRVAWRVSAVLLLMLVVDMHADMRWNTHAQLDIWARFRVSNDWYAWVAWWIEVIGVLLAWLILSLNSVLGFLWLRRLALRVLNANLAEHSAIVGVGFAVSSGALILYALMYDWLERVQPLKNKTWSLISVAFIACVVACVMTCALWSLLNLVRFTLAFRRAAKESGRRWRDADHAVQMK